MTPENFNTIASFASSPVEGNKTFWGELEAQRVTSKISYQISFTIIHFNDVMNPKSNVRLLLS